MPVKKITRTTKVHKKKNSTKKHNLIDVKTIQTMFNKKVIHRLARETDFIRRQGKLDAYNFFFNSFRFGKCSNPDRAGRKPFDGDKPPRSKQTV